MKFLKTFAALFAASLGTWMIWFFIESSKNGIILVQPTAVWTMLVMGCIFLPLSLLIALMAWSRKFEDRAIQWVSEVGTPKAPRRNKRRPRRRPRR